MNSARCTSEIKQVGIKNKLFSVAALPEEHKSCNYLWLDKKKLTYPDSKTFLIVTSDYFNNSESIKGNVSWVWRDACFFTDFANFGLLSYHWKSASELTEFKRQLGRKTQIKQIRISNYKSRNFAWKERSVSTDFFPHNKQNLKFWMSPTGGLRKRPNLSH